MFAFNMYIQFKRRTNMTINSISFAGKYVLDANQKMPDRNTRVKRDDRIHYWCDFATNGFRMRNDFEEQAKGPRDKAYKMEFEIPDKFNTLFEDSMNKLGQNFNKIG